MDKTVMKILALVVVLMMILAMVPSGAFAEDDDWVEVWIEDHMLAALSDSTSTNPLKMRLGKDVELEDYLHIKAGKTVIIDLNGHRLFRNIAVDWEKDGMVLLVEGDLTVVDPTGKGQITGGKNGNGDRPYVSDYGWGGGGVLVNGGTFTLKGGTITGNLARYQGGGVYITNNGTFNLIENGRITDNIANQGGGVAVGSGDGNVFTMKGGMIDGNTAEEDYGGGVMVQGTFYMEDGTIQDNKCLGTGTDRGGGGVHVTGKFYMSGGKIKNNYAGDKGGGVFVNYFSGAEVDKFIVSGSPVITGNYSGTEGNYLVDNVYLPLKNGTSDSAMILIKDALTKNASIGVRMQSPGVFTKNYSPSNSAHPDEYFTSDDDYYWVTKKTYSSGPFEAQLHHHEFSYKADGADIIATCSDADGRCDLTDRKIITTVIAEDAEYDGEPHGATLENLDAFNRATRKDLSEENIVYSGRGDTEYDPASDAPTEIGKYTASIDFNGLANGPAFRDYEILAQQILPPEENPKTDVGGRTFISIMLLLISLAAVCMINGRERRRPVGLE